MWPFTVCSYLGRYFLTRYNVRPEKVAKKFCFVASIHVEIGGMKHAWWREIARFCFNEHSYTKFSENCSIIGGGYIYSSFISFPFISNINSFVSGSLSPIIITLFVFLSIIMTSFSSKNPNIRYHRIIQSTLTHV